MARITIEDCISKVPNHFELIVLAARRARELSGGEVPRLRRNNDKNAIVALREIAAHAVSPEDLSERAVAALSMPTVIGSQVADDPALLADLSEVTISEDGEADED